MLSTAIEVPSEVSEMKLKRRGLLGGFNRFRLMLTLGLAVVLPAAALIYVNFSQLREFERDKVLEAAIHRDFQEMLAITEKNMNKKAASMTVDARNLFPSSLDQSGIDENHESMGFNDIFFLISSGP